jgi:prepilin-type N-terminal cleavage/methylation domain-containing protein
MIKNKKQKGFTLIEILVVIGIIAILAGIVLVAINPARQFASARDTERSNALNVLLNAIGQNMVDNKGVFVCNTGIIPSTLTPLVHPLTAIPVGALRIATGTADVNLGCLVPTYVSSFPIEPGISGAFWGNPTSYDTGYYVIQDNSSAGGGRITVFSNQTETSLNRTNFVELTR